MHTRQCSVALFCFASLVYQPETGWGQDLESTSLEPAIPEVLTPVRLKQPRTEVPASVTVIDRELITSSGIRELPELMRLVPGMAVGARSGWDYVVSYHGTNRLNSRRMQVLIDGRSVYQAGLATIEWSDIPLAIEDIERIEVTRGPDTAAYGANAFLGIINIITRHPDDSPALRIKATAGTNSTEDYYVSTSGNLGGAGTYRITGAARRDSGFDHNARDQDRRDSKNLQFVNGRWLFNPTATWTLDLQAGYKTGIKTEDFTPPAEMSPNDHWVKDYFFSLNSQHFFTPNNSLKWQLDYARTSSNSEWRACKSLAELQIAPVDDYFVCGDLNEDSTNTRIDFDLQHTLLSANQWKLVSGLHAQKQYVDSQTYYQGSVGRTTYQVFANFEYRFSPYWSTTLAGSQEYLENGNRHFSPRAALLFSPDSDQTFRAVYSEAIRTPDLFENSVDWQYSVHNITPSMPGFENFKFPDKPIQGPNNLKEERIKSREIGYYGLWLDRRLAIDVKAYWDDLDHLISQTLNANRFKPDNSTSAEQQGFETEIDYRISDRWRTRLNYALINSSATDSNEVSLTPHKSGSAGIIYTLPRNWQLSTFYYYAYPINENKFTRWDTRVAKHLSFFGSTVTISGVVQHYFYKYADLFDDNLYDSPNRIYLSVDLSL